MYSKSLCLILLLSATAASGQTIYRTVGGEAAPSGAAQACKADIQRYCAQSSGKQAFECLLDHQQDISDGCYDALKRRMQSGQGDQGNASPAGQACRQDAQQFCKGVQPGGGRIVNCLLDHQKDLSDACYDTLAKRRQEGRR